MIILRDNESRMSGKMDGLATVSGGDIYAVVLHKDGSTVDVSAYHSPSNADYSVVYITETYKSGTIQIAPSGDLDAILIGGRGMYSEENDWFDLDIGGMNVATKSTNYVLIEFVGDEFLVSVDVDTSVGCLPTIKREAPTLWSRGGLGRLVIEQCSEH